MDIVFDKFIFSNVFNKDIRKVYIYKKAERLASALYLIAPAFRDSVSLKSRAEDIGLMLMAAASLPPRELREALSGQLLALSSVLSMARAGGLLSPMNVDLILHEVHALLAEVASYEEPQLTLMEAPTLATLAKHTSSERIPAAPLVGKAPRRPREAHQGQITSRQDTILSLIKEKGTVSIKDISLIVRGVSEKTIQRELQALVETGRVSKRGQRRWSTYSLA
jgi:DNA-binding transcriptional ArsR family regulator